MAHAEILLVIEKMDNYLIKMEEMDGVVKTKYGYNQLRSKVESARNDLRLILDFLKDKKLEEGSSLKYSIFDAVEIASHAHHLINTSGMYNNLGVMQSKFEPYRKALSGTKMRILRLGVDEGANKSSIITSSSPLDEYVVGLEEEVESVLRKSTTCIVGMAGVGKTTLARKVYNHPTVVDYYEPRVWVSVSGEPSNKEVLMKLLQQVLVKKDPSHVLLKEMENADNQRLQHMLQLNLGHRYLIVFDDIGKIPYFKSILNALPSEGKIILTSRFRSIEDRVNEFRYDVSSLVMKPLDDVGSWQLFLQLLLFGNQNFPKQLEVKGKEMLRRCDGLPLSIKDVATQIVKKRENGCEWEEVLESIDLSATFHLLESIYHSWSPQLRSGFLCLSFFTKYTPIRREKLVQVWTAGQVVPHEDAEDEDFQRVHLYLDFLGRYKTTLKKLLDESVIDVDRRKDKYIKFFHINPSFHQLSMVKAHEEMVFETLKNSEGNSLSSKEPRHRAIYGSRDEFNHFTDHDEQLVSLFFRGGGYFDASEHYWKRFQQLRTLDFEGFGLKMLPESIGALSELRYLGLRDNYIQELPQSLGRLEKLEVLDIALNFMIEVPDIVWKIKSLCLLYMSDIICLKPLKFDELWTLKTLTQISVDNWTYGAWTLEVMNLRELGIEDLDEYSDVSKLFELLAKKWFPKCLMLRGSRFRSLPSLHGLESLHQLMEIRLDGLINKLPSAGIFPPKITHLSLINSCLDEDPMPELGKLEDLTCLKLKNAYTGQQMVIPNRSFLCLQVLCLEELWHLRNIQVGIDTFQRVKLKIKSCPYMENIPENISTNRMEEIKVITTRKIASKIPKSDFKSKVEHVDIRP